MSAHPISGAVSLETSAATKLLGEVVSAAKSKGPKAIVAFDLDSTLLNNSPRQSLIMREYGSANGVVKLAESTAAHWDSWDFYDPMIRAGLSPEEAKEHQAPFTNFWKERFFSSDYCHIDIANPGATTFVNDLAQAGSQICYLTGRHEGMRDGTVQCFEREGFPVPVPLSSTPSFSNSGPGSLSKDQPQIYLWMKPSLSQDDDDFKITSYSALKRRGEVIAAFDNEPTHINAYKETFPNAFVIHLDTDCSPRPVKVAANIPSIKNFHRG